MIAEQGEKMDSKAKTAVIGRVSISISEIVCSSSVEQRLPLSLHIDGIARDATLTVSSSHCSFFQLGCCLIKIKL